MASSLYSLAYLGAVMALLLAYARHYQLEKRKQLQGMAQFYEFDFYRGIYQGVASSSTRNVKLEKAALVAWTSELLTRAFKMQEAKGPMTVLTQSSLVGDDLLHRYNGTEVLLRQELQGLAGNAEKIQSGWAQQLMGAAQEVSQNRALRKRLAQMEVFADEYRSFAKPEETK